MIPAFDVIDHDLDWRTAAFMRVTLEEWQEGTFTATHGYTAQSPLSWEEAEEAIAEESRVLRRLDADSATPEQFEDLASEAAEDAWVDLGTVGLVCAMSAAGFWTYTSCRGHQGRGNWDVPFVGVIADRPHLEELEPLAMRTGCGFSIRSDGLVDVFADRVTALHDLALLILERQGSFDALGQVPFADD